MKRNAYIEITNQILAQLEAGTVPWVKPWSATPGRNRPYNAVTKRPYSGCNVMLLWLAEGRGWPLPAFLTYKQAQELGGHVRKGETGTTVYFVKQLRIKEKTENGDETERTAGMMRAYTVFNVAQCEGLPARLSELPAVKVRNSDERDATIDEFVAHTQADVREGFGEAYYRPGSDFVSMPAFEAFKAGANFYATLFHEMGHWTGHKSRLDRDLRNRFGDAQYAAEELVAELCAAFLCAEFDVDGDVRHASYIASWISLLKSDPKAFVTAASKAQAAADYMRGLALADAPKAASELPLAA